MSDPGPTMICASEDRRNMVADAGGPPGAPNGIDFLEILPASGNAPTLNLHFIFDVSTAGLTADNFSVVGGERIRSINVTGVALHAGDVTALDLTIDTEGDFSDYVLILQQPNHPELTPSGFDRQLRTVKFRFHPDCPARFDCAVTQVCPAPPPPPVTINYLAKDYATFRQLILDRMSLLAPAWSERNVADIGIALVELVAYAADRLSYRQDFNATEAYLATARMRTSVKRHVRLVDYDMNDGANARAWVHLDVKSAVVGSSAAPAIPAGTRFVTALPGMPVSIPADAATFRAIARTGAQVFEALGPAISLDPELNQVPFYNWSATECCLPVGATKGTLAGSFPPPKLRPGDVLMLAEVRGPNTGNPEDADPRRRLPVRLVSITTGTDPLNGNPVTDITWDAEDALPFPLCIAHSTGVEENRVTITGVSAALGNMVMVDHGRTVGPPVEIVPQTIGTVVAGRHFRPQMPEPYLTFAAPNPYRVIPGSNPPTSDGTLKVSCSASGNVDPTTSLPLALSVTGTLTIPNPLGGPPEVQTQTWTPLRSLFDPALADSPFAFVVEVETDGKAYLRFGDGVDGALPHPGAVFSARSYRVGDMSLGNVGAETITHVMLGQTAITAVTNPLPAAGGLAPEAIESARSKAPYAFNTQERAVTLDDYARVTMACPTVSVLRAVSTYRLTRSWRTVFTTVELKGGKKLDAEGRQKLINWLDIYRMAGVDVDFESAHLIPLELAMHVCVDPTYRRADVQAALIQRFSDRQLPDGTFGVFYPDNFKLGDPVYLGPIYAAAQSIAGVVSVDVTTFQRADLPGGDGIKNGYLKPGRTEAFTLRNNPDFPEQGTFTLTVDGGR
jgi:hypothetical protein